MNQMTLDQLVALNREICAMAGAGVPLDQGLIRVAQEFSGPTKKLAQRVANRTAAGATLSDAIDAEQDRLPESYRAMVRVGLQSGKLTAALEGYGQTAERLASLRRMSWLAASYPLVIASVVWVLLIFFASTLLPTLEWVGINDQFWLTTFQFSTRWIWYAAAIVPTALVALFVIWLRKSAIAATTMNDNQWSWMSWVPGAARIRRLGSEASFADLLGLFIAHRIPLNEALPLAGAASGRLCLKRAATTLGHHVAMGNTLTSAPEAFQQFPPLVRLALINGHDPDTLSAGLHHAAAVYQSRAQTTVDRVCYFFPLIFTAVVGGTAVAAYGIVILQPYAASLREIAGWS